MRDLILVKFYERGDYMDDIIIQKLVTLRFMHFPDNSIDYKLNGRPYLIFSMDDKYAYLLKLSSKRSNKNSQYYYEILPDSKNKLKNKSYVDLRYFLVFTIEELERKVITQETEKKSKNYGFIQDDQYKEILNRINTLYVNDFKFI